MKTFWRTLALPVLIFALATRFVLFIAVWISLRAVDRLDYYPAQLPDSFMPGHPWLDGWARWDAAHYVAIAHFGYGSGNPSQGEGLGFLPAYPMLMRYLIETSGVIRSDAAFAVAGILIANALFLGATALMAALASQMVPQRSALTAAMLLAVSPFAFFFSAAYSESLFLVICLASFYLANRNSWTAAAAIASLASATRIAGLFMAPALAFGAYRAGVRGWRLVWSFIGPLLGFLFWSLFTWQRHGNLFAYFDAQSLWGGWNEHVRRYAELLFHHPTAFVQGDPRNSVILLNLSLAIICVILLPRVWKTTSPTVAMFTSLIVLAHLAVTWVSLGRYLLPAVGLYVAAATFMTPDNSEEEKLPVREMAFVILTIAMTTLAVLFAHGFWIV